MQVFMPFSSFQASISCLDKTRLGNQIWREAKTLITGGWPNHPAAKLWHPYKPALAQYCLIGLDVLLQRGDIKLQAYNKLWEFYTPYVSKGFIIPPFIGNELYHKSHRLNLLWKLPSHYSKFFDEEPPTVKPDYYWPLNQIYGLRLVRN